MDQFQAPDPEAVRRYRTNVDCFLRQVNAPEPPPFMTYGRQSFGCELVEAKDYDVLLAQLAAATQAQATLQQDRDAAKQEIISLELRLRTLIETLRRLGYYRDEVLGPIVKRSEVDTAIAAAEAKG